MSPPAAVWCIKRWETNEWSDVLSSLSAGFECFHLQYSICFDSCSHTHCTARSLPGSWRIQERTCSLPCRSCHHNQRGLPGWHRKRGKLTYKRRSCCWRCRKGLRKRKMCQEVYFSRIWRQFHVFNSKKDWIKMSKTDLRNKKSYFIFLLNCSSWHFVWLWVCSASYHSPAASSRLPVWFWPPDRLRRTLHNWRNAALDCPARRTGRIRSRWGANRYI